MNGASQSTESPSLRDEVMALEKGSRSNGGPAVRSTRIGHKKSRNGCQQCKKRRVKVSRKLPS